MFLYWPTAIIRELNMGGKVSTYYTSDGYYKEEDAKKVIDFWKDNKNYEVLCAYIEQHGERNSKKIVYLENNIDALGYVSYRSENVIIENTPRSKKTKQ